MAVAPNRVVYVNTWSGRYYHNAPPPPGGFLIVFPEDSNGSGRADKIVRFGLDRGRRQSRREPASRSTTAMRSYAETNDRIVRYPLPTNGTGIAPTGAAETVVLGLPLSGRPSDAPLCDRRKGQPLCRSGVGDQFCARARNPMPNVPGNNPCTEFKTRGAPAVTTPIASIGISCRLSGLSPVCAMARVCRLIPRAGFSRRCTAVTSSGRTGPSCTH